ncbi:hypothetical protein [Paraliobacillus sp. JSM ZJ581]|uniref:hypothetical protein n=1 Tax=Paraliobacillus sp. JSM ZJ581 TaxID=3342118 RepID=UPI0035A93745
MDDIVAILTMLFAVGGGLFGLFGQKDDSDDKKTSMPLPNQKKIQTSHKKAEYKAEDNETNPENTNVYLDEKQAQLDDLKANMEINYDQVNLPPVENRTTYKKDRKQVKVNKRKTSFSISKNISKEGLAESVIMAEVLGPPRAKKPYQRKIYK